MTRDARETGIADGRDYAQNVLGIEWTEYNNQLGECVGAK